MSTRQDWNNAGKDVVVLHMFPRGRQSPNPSHYPLKLETFLRMTDIKYVPEFKKTQSAKGKSPWMTFNGEDIADSQFCIEHLSKTLGKDLSSHLTSEEKAIARGMRAILEDHLYFCLVMERWAFTNLDYIINEVFGALPVPGFVAKLFLKRVKPKVIAQAKGQGIGRHSKEEIRQLGIQNLKALSDFLGEKPYLMGNQPTEVDCVLFGFITQFYCSTPSDSMYNKALRDDFPNLIKHFERIKEQYWKDWEECKAKD